MLKQMYSIAVPRSVKHALELDTVNNNTKWRDAMAKEISLMKEFKVFEPINEGIIFKRKDGRQYTPFIGYLQSNMTLDTK